jgi:DNA-binding transcriptional regulator YiaG
MRSYALADRPSFLVDTLTVCNWEKNRTSPRYYLFPKIMEFLGYNPLQSDATTLGEKIKQCRIREGLSLRRLARELGIDPGTIANWERGRSNPKRAFMSWLDEMLNQEHLNEQGSRLLPGG